MIERIQRLWAEMNRLPGPLWAFGAYAVVRFVTGIDLLFQRVLQGVSYFDWWQAATDALVLVSNFLPLLIAWCLVRRKNYALSLAWWYAGMKILCCLLMLVQPFLYPGMSFDALTFLPVAAKAVLWGVVWLGFMRYLDRAPELAELYPPEQRRVVPWWLGGLILVILLVCG